MKRSKVGTEPKAEAKTPAQQLMERETRVSFGPVPHCLFGEPLAVTSWQMSGDRFLLRGEGDHYFYYRRGEGLLIERGANADLSEESLWLNGSVYAAIASLNGFLPIHASAVAVGGAVYAFTGPPGAGKSTLVAALGSRGLPMFCDDTLVLDLSDPERITCLPGHKRLKLRPDAVALTGAAREEKVSATVDKFYASPRSGDLRAVLPLAELIFLEEAEQTSIAAISGAERLARMHDDHYTALLFAFAHGFDRTAHFAHLETLARRIRMARFTRPLDRSRFDEGVALALDYVTGQGRD